MKSASLSKTDPFKYLFLFYFMLLNASQIMLQAQKTNFPYQLSRPDETFILPPILNEISGNALLNQEVMLCIQDEIGELFFYDLRQKKIIKHLAFANDGDFEDVALVGKDAWVLRSSGKLYRINMFEDASKTTLTEYKTSLSKANNCEGLCYDPVDHVLLIACKASPASKKKFVPDGFRAIYRFDLKTNTFIEKPVYLIDLQKVFEFVTRSTLESANKITIPQKMSDYKFEPSAIAVHPETKEIWVMASTGKAIVVLSRKGEILAAEHLSKSIFAQPEGITFSPGSTLYISSEGNGGDAKLLKFEMKK